MPNALNGIMKIADAILPKTQEIVMVTIEGGEYECVLRYDRFKAIRALRAAADKLEQKGVAP